MTRQYIQLRRDTAANWTAANPVLRAGEAGFESDTRRLKIGDGTTAWNSLLYLNASGGGTLAGLSDVDATTKVDGSVVYYDATASKFLADNATTKITLTDGGNF
jgi:hypothetical protein